MPEYPVVTIQRVATGYAVTERAVGSCIIYPSIPEMVMAVRCRFSWDGKGKRPKKSGKDIVSGGEIVKACIEAFGLNEWDFFGRKRATAEISECRRVAVWLLRHLTHRTYTEIAAMVGVACHTTVVYHIHGLDKKFASGDYAAWKMIALAVDILTEGDDVQRRRIRGMVGLEEATNQKENE